MASLELWKGREESTWKLAWKDSHLELELITTNTYDENAFDTENDHIST